MTGVVVTQGDPASPIIFNIVVDAVVRAVLEEVCIPQESQHGMGWEVGESNLVFYADDGRISGWDHEWVQDALTLTVAMFLQMGIEANLEKTKAMVCTPGFIWGGGGVYKRRVRGEGVTFRDCNNMRVSCSTYGVTVAAS